MNDDARAQPMLHDAVCRAAFEYWRQSVEDEAGAALPPEAVAATATAFNCAWAVATEVARNNRHAPWPTVPIATPLTPETVFRMVRRVEDNPVLRPVAEEKLREGLARAQFGRPLIEVLAELEDSNEKEEGV